MSVPIKNDCQKVFSTLIPAGTEVQNTKLWEYRQIFGPVDEWQWYIEFTPSPEFRRWLTDKNSFALETVSSDQDFRAVPDLYQAPSWFQVTADTTQFNIYQSKDGRMRLFERISDGRIFMTDHNIQ